MRAATGSEWPLGAAEVVDASTSGLLLALRDGAAPRVRSGDVVLVTVGGPYAVHLVGVARRCARGADERLYVGLEYRSVNPYDVELLLASGEEPPDTP